MQYTMTQHPIELVFYTRYQVILNINDIGNVNDTRYMCYYI